MTNLIIRKGTVREKVVTMKAAFFDGGVTARF